MDLARLHHVFLFVAWITIATALLEPPVNVTLHCHNFTNILMWDYDRPPPNISFRVDVHPYSGKAEKLLVESLQADLSRFSDPSNTFFITVTAVLGGNESTPGPSEDGITYSYFKVSPDAQKCFVDLPSVTVTTQPHDQVQFRFEHPWLFYKQKLQSGGNSKSRKKKSTDAQINERLPVFAYDVVVIDQGKPHSYKCEERVCESKLYVDATKKEHCLKINGELEQMSVISKEKYCTLPGPAPSPHDYIYIIVSVLVLIPVAAVGFMVFRKHTRPLPSVPPSMTFNGPLPQRTLRPVTEYTHIVQEGEPSSPTPLLTPTEEQDERQFTTQDDVLRLHLGMRPEDEVVSDVTEQGEPNLDGSAYMQGKNFEDDEADTGRSDYERRPVLAELAPGEIAEGYRG